MKPGEKKIWNALQSVMDPEIPVVSLLEMGIIREVEADGDSAVITITPTFSGCPALTVMQRDIAEAVRSLGYTHVDVRISLSPPWTTDWISPDGREKLRSFGIAPPHRHQGQIEPALLQPVTCPYCGSMETTLRNSFGPTPCRMIFTCQGCRQPFEQFKPL